jgi:peptidoglycan/xylan/chitin deacetylase (PgdA/CDA1 family)
MLETMVFELASLLPAVHGQRGTSVLCYHEVVPERGVPLSRYAVHQHTLELHLHAARESGRQMLSLPELPHAIGASTLITFDDNLRSHVLYALPVLSAAQVSAAFFLNPGELGAEDRLTRRDVDTLLSAGMMIGAHGFRHVPAVDIAPDRFAADASACASFLESLGMPLTWAYPGGHIGSFTSVHERILADHGFRIRFSTLDGLCRPDHLDRVQGRYVIRRDSSIRYVRSALSGGLGAITALKKLKAMAS